MRYNSTSQILIRVAAAPIEIGGRVFGGIVDDSWYAKTDGTAQHTEFYQHTLGQYLQYFGGRRATYVQVQGPAAATEANAFAVLRRGLGITDEVAEGDTVRLALSEFGPLDAVVDYLTPHFIGLRTTDGLYRFFGGNAWGMPVGLSLHLSPPALTRRRLQAWQFWLDGIFS